MSQQTGEDERSLHRILDFIRMGSLLVLGLHFYAYACPGCKEWQSANPIADRLLTTLTDTAPLNSMLASKLTALAC